MLNKPKIIVIDVDETLGYFVELGIFWDSLHNYAKTMNIDAATILTQHHFNETLDIFPEFVRPKILSILQYIKLKKILKQCDGVIIYTNNQGPKEWIQFIKNYFESKLKYKLFSNVISAFKINGRPMELCRTSHDKTIEDLMRCSKIRDNTEICFLDDTYHPDMNKDNVYYIKIKPYIHDLEFDTMIERYVRSPVSKKLLSNKQNELGFIDFMKLNMTTYEFAYFKKSNDEYDIDKIVSKKTMAHLHIFFNKNKDNGPPRSSHKKTIKNKSYKSKTRKNR